MLSLHSSAALHHLLTQLSLWNVHESFRGMSQSFLYGHASLQVLLRDLPYEISQHRRPFLIEIAFSQLILQQHGVLHLSSYRHRSFLYHPVQSQHLFVYVADVSVLVTNDSYFVFSGNGIMIGIIYGL